MYRGTPPGAAEGTRPLEDEQEEDVPLSQVAHRRTQLTPWATDGEDSDRDGLLDDDKENGAPSTQQGTNGVHWDTPAFHSRRKAKTFQDTIHGTIRMAPEFLDFIDTRPYQRLRELKQLGTTYYIFPNAVHTRFEHSLGVGSLGFSFAETLLQGCKERARRGLALPTEVRQADLISVALAGLCHDLGHGPFSHVWDSLFASSRGFYNWKHEDMSCKMFDYIRDTHHIDSITDDQAKLVKQLILGDVEHAPDGKKWIFDIVANSRSSLDVDKADYLERDAYYTGVKISCDFPRLSKFAQVFDDQICYKASEYANIQELFHSRYMMHKRVYTHRKGKSIEYMIVDALVLADQTLHFSQDMDRPEVFATLDDSILRRVEDSHIIYPSLADDPNLVKARDIIKKMRNRELYRYVNEALVPAAFVAAKWTAPTPADLCGYWHANGEVQLNPDEVIVDVVRLNWAKKDKNPLDSIKWFDDYYDTTPRDQPSGFMSSMNPLTYQDVTLRVYSKNRDSKVVAALDSALKGYVKHRFGDKHELATPCRANHAPPSSQGTALRAQSLLIHSVIKRPGQGASQQPTQQTQGAEEQGPSQAADVPRQKPNKRRRSLAEELAEAMEEGAPE